MVKLKRLKIHRYRDVEPCELVFGDRFNVLLGPNGSGKTTLLHLIARILRSSLREIQEPYSIEVDLSFPRGALTGRIENDGANEAEPPRFPQAMLDIAHQRGSAPTRPPMFDLHLRLKDPPSVVELRRAQMATTMIARGVEEDASELARILDTSRWSLLGWVVYYGALAGAGVDVRIDSHVQNVVRFDESLDTFRAVVGRLNDPTIFDKESRPRVLHASSGEGVV